MLSTTCADASARQHELLGLHSSSIMICVCALMNPNRESINKGARSGNRQGTSIGSVYGDEVCCVRVVVGCAYSIGARI